MKQLLKSATGLIGLGLFAYLFIFFAWDATKIVSWQRSGVVGSHLQLAADSTLTFQIVDSTDFLKPPRPHVGDTLLSIEDTSTSRAAWAARFNSPNKPWQEIPIRYLHAGDTLTADIVPAPPRITSSSLVILLQCLRFLITFLYVSVALWAFFRRPDSAAVRVLALFCFAMAGLMISGVNILSDEYASFDIPLKDLIRNLLDYLSSIFSALWLHLTFLFPHPVRLMQKRPVLAHLICYLPVALVLAVVSYVQAAGLAVNITTPVMTVFGGQVVAGLTILVVRHVRGRSHLERRQTRLVIWGSGFGLTVLIALIVFSQVFQEWLLTNPRSMLIAINFAFAALLASPVSFAYAFNRYRLLEVEARLRRGTRYVLAIAALVAAMTVMGFAVGTFARRYFGEEGGTLAVLVAVLAAFSIFPLLRAARVFLERRLYPERQRLRGMFHDFLQQAFTVTDSRAFWKQIEIRFEQGLAVRGVFPVVRARDNGHFLCRESEETPFHTESLLVEHLEREPRPLMVDEAIASLRVPLSIEESTWLSDRRIALVLPLITHSRLVGFLGLGSKTEQDDYAAEELQILSSLASQVALASENIRLIEENVGKRRLEEQLEMARRIQSGFLPTEIPPTPGLEIAARSRFCLEVAGDYFDIIPLENGETVMAVGDVSGKGAGAAMLMANLQASLRTAVGMGVSLTDVVARINDLTHRNTPPEEYITFFVGTFRPDTHQFRYVNAGHNPPLVRHHDGTIRVLHEGGLLLGVMRGVAYEEGEVTIAPGELLLMYTDGVSEAMNERDEEFGEQRIRELLERANALSPQEALEALEADVAHHSHRTTLDDDFTLLLARAR
ncbi:SpoIIE family protein phosphatase [bacterium]|nr:SpoIIE family protein phosphatase [bacterium]MBU1985305.1 SpoIIE family protein phosphatase [bacterium]